MARLLTSALALLVLLSAGDQNRPAAACDDLWPAWSPDGRRIVFSSTRTGDPEVYVKAIDAEDPPVRLTFTLGRDAHPSFSPDGSLIAFQSPREPGGHTNLYLMNADGSGQRRITNHAGFAGMPVWSPDGRMLAYQWTPELSASNWRLMLVAAEPGSEPRELTQGEANDQVINWAPDGRRFVFHSDRTGVNQIFTMAREGAVTQVTHEPSSAQSGAWSPDGRSIAFRSDRDGVLSAVYVMNADGSNVRRIGSVAGEHGVPFFSPDGSRLLVTRRGPSGAEIVALRLADGGTELISRCTAQVGPRPYDDSRLTTVNGLAFETGRCPCVAAGLH